MPGCVRLRVRDMEVTGHHARFLLFLVDSGAPGHDEQDRAAALDLRGKLLEKYPNLMATRNIGHKPNDALFHAETTVLTRAARWAGGSLAGRKLTVQVDRDLCGSCKIMMPKIGLELGNPTITFVEPSGIRRTMENGSWDK